MLYMSKPKLWTKDFIIISSTNFFSFVTFYLLMATISLFVTEQYHASQSVAGLAVGIFVIATLLARIVIGKYLDRIGRKRVLIVSLIVFLVITLLHFEANSLMFLMIIRFIHGAAFGVISTTAGAVVADLIPDERRGEGTGYFAMSMNLAMAIGPFLGMILSQYTGFKTIFLVGSIFSVVGFIATLFLKVPTVELSEQQIKEIASFKVRDFFEPKAIPISVAVLAVTLAYSSLLSFLSTYAKHINLVEVSSFFFIVYAVALLATRPFTGRWFDERGANFVTYPLIICLAIGFFFLSQAHNSIIFLVAGALIGIGYGTVQSSFQAIAINQAPSHRKALATSTYFIFLDLANGVGPYVIGTVIALIGFRELYVAMSIWILACIGIYYVIYGKKAAAEKKSAAVQKATE